MYTSAMKQRTSAYRRNGTKLKSNIEVCLVLVMSELSAVDDSIIRNAKQRVERKSMVTIGQNHHISQEPYSQGPNTMTPAAKEKAHHESILSSRSINKPFNMF